MRNVTGIGLALLIVCGISGCGGGKPQDQIIGKWEAKEKGPDGKEMTMTTEFTKDGTVKMGVMGLTVEGKYKFIDDKNIELTMEMMGKKDTKKLKLDSISGDKMVLVDDKGEKKEFKKAP